MGNWIEVEEVKEDKVKVADTNSQNLNFLETQIKELTISEGGASRPTPGVGVQTQWTLQLLVSLDPRLAQTSPSKFCMSAPQPQ